MFKRFFFLASVLAVSVTSFAKPTDSDVKRAQALVKSMTLEEKVALISGSVDGFHTAAIERLGIPSVRMADGPQGVRNDTHSTYYPCGISLASSWNREVAAGVGTGIGYDAKARGVGIMLCPGVNIYRSALCGRNFEYYGEDPYLASEQACEYIKGIQSRGIMATIKHFALNNQEYDRHGTNSVADEKTMNVIYLPTFRKAVEKADVACVMTSYNPVNGVHAAENAELIGMLRGWGFDGIVMSDWSSTYTTLGVIKGGLDLEMPKDYTTNISLVKPLLDNGVISEDDIDQKCIHILSGFSHYGFLDAPVKDASIPEDYDLSRKLAYDAAVEGPVLLKNEGALPIKPSKKEIIILGPNADCVAFGGGSGAMSPFEERNVTFYQAMKNLGKGYKVRLMTGDLDEEALRKAAAVIVCAGFDNKTEKEGADRTYALPDGQDHMIRTAAEANANTIVIVNSGGEVDINGWKDSVSAIIFAWYGGQEGGHALADIVSGRVAPSGRLPFTFWGSLEKNPAYEYYQKTIPAIRQRSKNRDSTPVTVYGEGVYLGYRGVSHFGKKPMYPFGYGLSYTTFAYSDLKLLRKDDGSVDVCFTIKNTGRVAAKEVAQVYVNGVLKGFDKISLAPGKSSDVVVTLDADAFKDYSTAAHSWIPVNGVFEIGVGSSSADIKLNGKI